MTVPRSYPSLSNRHHRGFTLVELMIVVALVAVVATIAVPNFRQLVENNRITAGTNSIVSTLSYARSEAMRHGRLVTVAPRVEGDWGHGLSVSLGTQQLRVSEPVGSGVNITGGNLGFRGNGLANQARSFRLCGEGGRPGREINVTAGGRIKTREVVCNG